MTKTFVRQTNCTMTREQEVNIEILIDWILEQERQYQYDLKLFDEMKELEEEQDKEGRHHFLSKEFVVELTKLRYAILTMDSDAEMDSHRKCLQIGIEHDRLPTWFVVDRINDVHHGP